MKPIYHILIAIAIPLMAACSSSEKQSDADIKTTAKIENINYVIIKEKSPNFVKICTYNRLTRDEVAALYDEFNDSYNAIHLTTSLFPEDDEYIQIHDGYIFEFDIDSITKLSDY